MPAQKCPLPEEAVGPDGSSHEEEEKDHASAGSEGVEPTTKEEEDLEGEGGSESDTDTDEFILVQLADIRKEVQCPICLGIIRKTRTVMECLHRFCRGCIDKSMRLGNNECPACRTHCASRRSLRDDPNYDALISALYPDIDKYEEEVYMSMKDLFSHIKVKIDPSVSRMVLIRNPNVRLQEFAFLEEVKDRNKKVQASIAETLRRQTEALGRRRPSAKSTAAAFVKRSQGNYRHARGRSSGRGTSLPGSDDEDEEDENGNDSKDSSSADEPSPDRRKRCRRWMVPQPSPARTSGNADANGEENGDTEAIRETQSASPLRAGNREMLAWGKGGVRSQTRHGNSSGSNGRLRTARATKLADYLRNLEETDDEFGVHLTMLPLDEQSNIQRPYLYCRPSLSISHLCQYIALQACIKAEEVEIYVRKSQFGTLKVGPSVTVAKTESDSLEDLLVVDVQETLARLRESFTSIQGDLVLVYCSKSRS